MNSKKLDLKEMRAYLPKNFSEVQKSLFYSVVALNVMKTSDKAHDRYVAKWQPYPTLVKTEEIQL